MAEGNPPYLANPFDGSRGETEKNHEGKTSSSVDLTGVEIWLPTHAAPAVFVYSKRVYK